MSSTMINGSAHAAVKGKPIIDMAIGGEPRAGPSSLAGIPGLNLFSLAEQCVIVTGGARGLGLAVAISLLEAGAAGVYCLDILQEPAEADWAEAQGVASKYGGIIEYHQADITNPSAVEEVMNKVFDRAPAPVTGFLAAAGIQQMIPAMEYPIDSFRRLMEVNVTGTFITIQQAARQFRQRNIPGSIVMVASMSGSIANKGLTCTAYNTSKSALLQMCRSTAAEWGQYGIRVNTLSPGYIRTAMTDGLLAERPDLEEEWLRGSMLNRLSTPDEYRGPVLFLLSKASSFVTGADLLVDGGHTAY